MCIGQERSAALRVVNLRAVPNANERGPHEMIDLVSDDGHRFAVWGSVHVDMFDLYVAAPEVYAALRAGKSLACELRVLRVED